MNSAIIDVPVTRKDTASEAEWNARVDLAAAYRLIDLYGWTNLIYNHLAMRVPDQPDHFLIKAHSVMFSEVCASNLIKLALNGTNGSWANNVNKAGFTIHSAVLNARFDINCTIHIHTKAGTAISAHPRGLVPLGQTGMRFYNRISYHDFEGVANDGDEGPRIARDLGATNKAMILRNHGLLACGASASEAVTLMRDLVEACEAQLLFEATGVKPSLPPEDVCERCASQLDADNGGGGSADWPAYLRFADRADPSYRS